ncbi:phosphohexomutase domain-containing protein [Streptomyces xanthochromogenes]|uniref:Phosphomannomutase/phosphoglucomutase n=1 Tax=Streptomyces xanthochromogenes TaxID=67384 RepID=A0ABQ3A6D8_9ACTN|nr:phosphomannomutase/phosphoglucomutase [Streptomyces xanthochromogenes]GGY37106.1 phosphomannomutase/phosphoglucomutase [Streptomyces xanthochromogenes]
MSEVRGAAERIVGAHGIRGRVPQELDPGGAYRTGAAFALLTGAPVIAVAHDLRGCSPALADAFAQGVLDQGADALDAGPGPADCLTYLSGYLEVPGALVTAGRGPGAPHGIRLCRAGAVAVAEGTGLEAIRERLAGPRPALTGRPGSVVRAPVLDDYAGHLRSLVDLGGIRPVRVVVDAAHGIAALTAPRALHHPAVEVVPVRFARDNGRAGQPGWDLGERVRRCGADLGLAFDEGADRCRVVDERGAAVPPTAVVALVAARELARRPGAAVVHDLITSRAAIEAVEEAGGIPLRSRVGRAAIRSLMAEQGAAFGAAHSGRYYFRDFWCADSAMLAALHLVAEVGETGRGLSELTAGHDRYPRSGEIGIRVEDPAAALRRVAAYFAGSGAELDHLDGVTGEFGDGSWFNVRAARGAPLVRIHVEAEAPAAMEALRDRVLAVLTASASAR